MIKAFRKTNRGAYANFLRAKFDAYTGARVVQSSPYFLCLDPCDICQLRCPTCPTGIENASRARGDGDRIVYRRQRGMMTEELFDTLLDELESSLFLMMFYNWGEPLLNKSLPRFIRKAHDLEIETEIHTNLSLPLTDAFIEELLGSGLEHLAASIDGFTQESYQVHRAGGDLGLVKRNLERLARARDRLGLDTEITYKMLVFRHNEHELPAAAQYCKDLGVAFVFGDAFIHDPAWLPSSRTSELPFYNEADMRALAERANAAGASGYFMPHEHHPAWSPKVEAVEASFCSWHYAVSVVTATGPVAPCCATAKERDDFGQVVPGQSRFGDVWNNDRYQHARSAFAGAPSSGPPTLCDRCYFPAFVQQLYAGHDLRIVSQFEQLFRDTEPVLMEAFRLLRQSRYGRTGNAGVGNERDMTDFVRFYEQNLSRSDSATVV